MSLIEKLKQHKDISAAAKVERDRELLAQYRGIMTTPEPSDEDVVKIAELMTALQLEQSEVEADQKAISRATSLQQIVKEMVARHATLGQELGEVRLRIESLDEQLRASERQSFLELEQASTIQAVEQASAEIERIRQEHPRVLPIIEPVDASLVPHNVKASPTLNSMLAAAAVVHGSEQQQAQYLRFRGHKMNGFRFWKSPVEGECDQLLPAALKRQAQHDLAAVKDLLPLLAGESKLY